MHQTITKFYVTNFSFSTLQYARFWILIFRKLPDLIMFRFRSLWIIISAIMACMKLPPPLKQNWGERFFWGGGGCKQRSLPVLQHKGYQYSMLRCHILLQFVWNKDKSPHARKNFQILFVFIFSTYHYFSPYRYKLDLWDPVLQNQQQIRLGIHTCTSQRCYCKQDWLHKHLGTGTHQHLNISTHHKLTNEHLFQFLVNKSKTKTFIDFKIPKKTCQTS